jgi:hypothetical protein
MKNNSRLITACLVMSALSWPAVIMRAQGQDMPAEYQAVFNHAKETL